MSQKQPRIEQGNHENGNLAGLGEILNTLIVVLFDTGARILLYLNYVCTL